MAGFQRAGNRTAGVPGVHGTRVLSARRGPRLWHALLCGIFVAAGAGAAYGQGQAQPQQSAPAAPKVALVTTRGTIVLELDPVRAPKTVENFLTYVRAHQYDGLLFHRVIPGFMIQGGGYDMKLAEKPTRAPIVNEATNGLKNVTGTVAMARTPDINSASAEFFINVHDNDFLDHVDVPPEGITVMRHGQPLHATPAQADQLYGYAVFGHVIEGMDVVRSIEKTPTKASGEFQNLPVQPVVIKTATILP